MPKIELVYFDGCPGISRARELLKIAGVTNFSQISQDGLEQSHPYRRYSSPTILVDDRIVIGSSNGAAACSMVDWEKADLVETIRRSLK